MLGCMVQSNDGWVRFDEKEKGGREVGV